MTASWEVVGVNTEAAVAPVVLKVKAAGSRGMKALDRHWSMQVAVARCHLLKTDLLLCFATSGPVMVAPTSFRSETRRLVWSLW